MGVHVIMCLLFGGHVHACIGWAMSSSGQRGWHHGASRDGQLRGVGGITKRSTVRVEKWASAGHENAGWQAGRLAGRQADARVIHACACAPPDGQAGSGQWCTGGS